ncbi:MAG: choice-of-anchor D domain-containing protein, partial [Nitrospirota bacterium]|nr:choice-of-anchor D domain-containing protein [Nitrospirota bacterium]
MKKQWITYFAFAAILVFAIMVSPAGAFDQYSTNRTSGNCADCHGNFRAAAPYISNSDGVAWKNPATGANMNLHDGHRDYMLSSDCNVCHLSSRFPTQLSSSNGGAGFPAIGCVGCHAGDGLRAHHVNSGAAPSGTSSYCYDCHSPATPPAENVKPPYYFTPDTAHPNKPTDPCNLNGTESALAPALGLDNNGNLLYDQNDTACVAAAPKISVSPTTLSFGNQAVNVTSASQTVTISNTGTASLNVSGISNSNATDFIVTAPATPFSVAAGGSQTFTMAFKPGSTGAKSTNVSITSNGGNATVSGAGTGVAPVLNVSPATLAFGNQTIGTTSAARTVTISNTGTGTLNV